MNLFIIDNSGNKISKDLNEFIDFWVNRYYDYTSISDSVYFEIRNCFREERDLKKAYQLLGAWKTGALNQDKRDRLAFKCNSPNCKGVYYFTAYWNPGTQSAYEIWISLHENFSEHTNLIKEDKIEEFLEKISNLQYKGAKSPKTKFGYIYAITYLHFINNQYPILDKFVFISLKYIYSSNAPILPYEPKTGINTPKDYLNTFVNLFQRFINGLSHEKLRECDKALWAFGHYISHKRKVKKKPCCRI